MTVGVRWLSLAPGSGFGNASALYLRGLRQAGVPVTWTPLTWPSRAWRAPFGPAADAAELDLAGLEHHDIACVPVPHDTVVVHGSPLWHERLAAEARGRRLIAFTAWETDRLSPRSVALLNRYDRVLVPSRFNVDVLERSGVSVPVVAVPHAVAETPDRLGVREGPDDGSTYVFYVIATWTSRKAILDTVSAFLRAFDERDPVELLIHTTPEDLVSQARVQRGESPRSRFGADSWMSLAGALANRDRVPRIRLSTGRLTAPEMDALHRRGDCFLGLARGEAWGLGAFEAGYHGNPVIVTGWGGSLEYLPEGYPFCAEYELVPSTADPADLWWEPVPGARWAKVRIEHAALLMRTVFEDRKTGRAWGRRLHDHISSTFSLPQVTESLLGALDGR